MASPKSKRVVYAAAAGNTLIAITKFGAAAYTGSSAMLSEAVHSVADTGNQLLLLYGMHRAKQPPDARHPLGYGRELYFWSFIVALIMFTLGAGVALYEGVQHILEPTEVTDPILNYIVLAFAFVFEGGSWAIALREFRRAKGDMGYFEAVRRSKDPPTFIVLFEDSAALLGILIAFAGTFAAQRLDMPALDGVASLGISLILGLTAIALARESKGLLIGEPASQAVRESILAIVGRIPEIERGWIIFTVHMSPDQVVVGLAVEFRDQLTTSGIEQATLELERDIHDAHPEVIAVFVKPQTTDGQRANPFGRTTGARRRFNALTHGKATPSAR
jgi:cation diffusion facilitator family transporter